MGYQLKEKVYFSSENEEKNFTQLESFFQEFASRKRGNSFETGLNGGIVIMPTKWAAKINENDGKAYHAHTNMNLVRFLNGERNHFGSELEAGRYALSKEETKTILKEDIIVSLVSNKNNCRIIMFCYNNKHSAFQLSTLKMILRVGQEISKEYSDCLEIGFFNEDGIIDLDRLTLEQKEKIENFLDQYQESKQKKLVKRRKNKEKF